MQKRALILDNIPELERESFIKPVAAYPFIWEFGCQHFKKVSPGSLKSHYNEGIEICYVIKGKYRWQVEGVNYTLFPGDCFITCPYEKHGGIEGFLDISELAWIIIQPKSFEKNGVLYLGDWCGFTKKDQIKMGEILKYKHAHKFINQEIGQLLEKLQQEISSNRLFSEYEIKRNVESLLTQTCRSLEKIRESKNTSPVFLNDLKCFIQQNISEKFNLKQLAGKFSMGSTSFNEKVKTLTGYSPANYIISIRLDEARKLLKNGKKSITYIALDCGFYSSQYFADTFKKWNGISPSEFRKKHESKTQRKN